MSLVAEYRNVYLSRYLVPLECGTIRVQGKERRAFTKKQIETELQDGLLDDVDVHDVVTGGAKWPS